jgi:hypothetical protein
MQILFSKVTFQKRTGKKKKAPSGGEKGFQNQTGLKTITAG